ncbi:alpha/beta hydrolase [Halalkalibacter alkalisediminis]|uniref:Alpha/beta hydrolase n=2 Tax=Halalkalibacter alkalisediminis TaxID=935616 RepID=A0ABV6NBZ0_9BACI
MIAVVFFLVFLTGASFYFYQVAIASTSKDFLSDNPDLEKSVIAESMTAMEEDPKAWISKQELETIEITSNDGLKLKGYFLKASKPTNKTIIIAHGYSGQAKDMGRYARFYYEKLGYHVLLPDARGHGKSDGNYIGFGWHERKDYLQWINVVIERVGEDSSIMLHGVSMGGQLS